MCIVPSNRKNRWHWKNRNNGWPAMQTLTVKSRDYAMGGQYENALLRHSAACVPFPIVTVFHR